MARIRAVVIQWTGSEDSRVLVPRAADRMVLFEDVELDFGQSLLKPDRSGDAGEPRANCKHTYQSVTRVDLEKAAS